MKRLTALILALVMLSSMWITYGAEDISSDTKWIEVPFTSTMSAEAENKLMIKWDWNDFLKNASTSGENSDLAIAGLVFSNQAEMSKEDVESVLKTVGFTDILSDYYASGTEHENSLSNPARTFAHREMDVNGVEKHIICAVFRGTTSLIDAMTDIKASKDGFKGAGENCVNSLKKYQESINGATKDNTILFITGHSLGASTASEVSLLAGDIADKSATHTYTIATPNYDTMGLKTEDYQNMYLYTNMDDIVPMVPANFTKVGNEKLYEYSSLSLDAKNKFDRVYKYLRNKTYDEDGNPQTTDLLGSLRDHMGFTYLSFILSEKSSAEIDNYIAQFELPKYKAKLNIAKQLGKYGIKAESEIYSGCQSPSYEFSIMKNGNWTSSASGANVVSFKKLSKGKTYSVKVRAAKTINGKTYYSQWSSEKKVKIDVTPSEIKSYKPFIKSTTKSGTKLKVKAVKCKICDKPTYQFAIKKNGKWKSSKTASTSKSFKKLSKRTTYKVRVRVVKKLGGKTYKSKWSREKRVRIR